MSRNILQTMHQEVAAYVRITQLIPVVCGTPGKPASMFGHLPLGDVLPKAGTLGPAYRPVSYSNQCLAGTTCEQRAKRLTVIRLTHKQGYGRSSHPLGTGSTACVASRIPIPTRHTWRTRIYQGMLDGDANHANIVSASRARTRLKINQRNLLGSLT